MLTVHITGYDSIELRVSEFRCGIPAHLAEDFRRAMPIEVTDLEWDESTTFELLNVHC